MEILENILNVEKVIELPVPATVIGDNVVNNIDDLIELSLDSFEVLDLKNPPILIVLSSSFFLLNLLRIPNQMNLKKMTKLFRIKVRIYLRIH